MKISVLLAVLALVLASAAHQKFCKCQCNGKKLIEPIDNCGSCTKDFCLTKDEKLCEVSDVTKTDLHLEDVNILISCYQIESFKDQLIIYAFVLVVFILCVYGLVFRR